jgi:hypothetical protein
MVRWPSARGTASHYREAVQSNPAYDKFTPLQSEAIGGVQLRLWLNDTPLLCHCGAGLQLHATPIPFPRRASLGTVFARRV